MNYDEELRQGVVIQPQSSQAEIAAAANVVAMTKRRGLKTHARPSHPAAAPGRSFEAGTQVISKVKDSDYRLSLMTAAESPDRKGRRAHTHTQNNKERHAVDSGGH